MIVKVDFPDHPKTLKLEELGGPGAPMWCIRIWGYCQIKRTNRFRNTDEYFTNSGMRTVFRIRNKNVMPLNILKDCGFIREEGDMLVVHDWDIVNKRMVASYNNGAKGGRPPTNKTHGFSSGYGQVKTHSARARQSTESEYEREKPNHEKTESDCSSGEALNPEAKPDPKTQERAAEFLKELSQKLRSGEPIT
ncbi:MAG TPA: hypothetical protein VFA85_12760 [Terriglobales bacterium]|nr:hypothetical protein [Terriglobales bacterium]